MGRQDLVIFAVRLKSNVAEKKNMHHNTCITKGSREYPEYMTVTAASLSQLALTVVPFHCLPQRTAIAIGLVLWLQFALVGWHVATKTESNLNEFQKAPAPHEPEASLHKSRSGWPKAWGRRMEMPFQDSMNMCCHLMSDLASLLILEMFRCLHFASVRREIVCQWTMWLVWPHCKHHWGGPEAT